MREILQTWLEWLFSREMGIGALVRLWGEGERRPPASWVQAGGCGKG